MIRRRMWSWARQIGRQPATTGRGATRVEVEGQVPLFLRRLAKLGAVICLLLAAGTLGFVVAEDSSPWTAFVWTLDTIATVDAIPSPETTGGQVVKRPAHRARGRYALLLRVETEYSFLRCLLRHEFFPQLSPNEADSACHAEGRGFESLHPL